MCVWWRGGLRCHVGCLHLLDLIHVPALPLPISTSGKAAGSGTSVCVPATWEAQVEIQAWLGLARVALFLLLGSEQHTQLPPGRSAFEIREKLESCQPLTQQRLNETQS